MPSVRRGAGAGGAAGTAAGVAGGTVAGGARVDRAHASGNQPIARMVAI
jgi:hypothetical protein